MPAKLFIYLISLNDIIGINTMLIVILNVPSYFHQMLESL